MLSDNGILHQEGINQNNKSYNLTIYIRFLTIVFDLESPDRKYSNSFSLRDLIRISKYFQQDDNEDINTAFSDLKDLLVDDLSIIEEGLSANLITHYKKK